MKVTYSISIEPEEIPVRGNSLASGDNEVNKQYADEIIRQLDAGNDWAWCAVTVTATFGEFSGQDHLGCCSYASEEEFRKPGGYWDDMKAEAIEALKANIESARVTIRHAETQGLLDEITA